MRCENQLEPAADCIFPVPLGNQRTWIQLLSLKKNDEQMLPVCAQSSMVHSYHQGKP